MHAQQIYHCVLAVVLVTSTCAAPLQEKAKEKKDVAASAPAVKAAEQEAELEKLVSLAGQEAKHENVAVHESQVTHYENKNGKEIKVEQTEQKVTDMESGKLLADVTQEVAEAETGKGGEPQTVSQTEVDIPDKGIHETFVEDGREEEEEEEAEEQAEQESREQDGSIQYSPAAVAEHLLLSNDFDNFYSALKELVSSSFMTEEEAGEYEAQVIAEYQRLIGEQPQTFPEMDGEEVFPSYVLSNDKRSDMRPMPDELPTDLYNIDPAYESYVQNDLGLGSDGLEESNEDSLSGIIDTLLNAWWEKDFQGGNVRAQALVSYLYDVVSRDGNPDDIGQIRSILADILANSLLDDVENAENEYKLEQALQSGQIQEVPNQIQEVPNQIQEVPNQIQEVPSQINVQDEASEESSEEVAEPEKSQPEETDVDAEQELKQLTEQKEGSSEETQEPSQPVKEVAETEKVEEAGKAEELKH